MDASRRNVPDPARFALHKLMVSGRRQASFAAKICSWKHCYARQRTYSVTDSRYKDSSYRRIVRR